MDTSQDHTAPARKPRIAEYQVQRALQICLGDRQMPTHPLHLGVAPSEDSWWHKAELDGDFDGWLLGPYCIAVRRAADKIRLVDDDKQKGVTQSFLSDMFVRRPPTQARK